MSRLDYRSLVKPQADTFDTRVLIGRQVQKFGPRLNITTSQTLADGHIAVFPDPFGYNDDYFKDAPREYCTDDRLANIDMYLNAWPEGYRSLEFLTAFWPKWVFARPDQRQEYEFSFRGCSSGHEVVSANTPYTGVYVSINDAQGCAEGIYHEVGHLRLENLGVGIDTHDGVLFDNRPDELYNSPVRFDIKRPLSACLHGLYSWMMFTENDIWCATKFSADDSCIYMKTNIPKIENGLNEVRQHVRPTRDGVSFFDGLFEWGTEIVSRGRTILLDTLGAEEYNKLPAQTWTI